VGNEAEQHRGGEQENYGDDAGEFGVAQEFEKAERAVIKQGIEQFSEGHQRDGNSAGGEWAN